MKCSFPDVFVQSKKFDPSSGELYLKPLTALTKVERIRESELDIRRSVHSCKKVAASRKTAPQPFTNTDVA